MLNSTQCLWITAGYLPQQRHYMFLSLLFLGPLFGGPPNKDWSDIKLLESRTRHGHCLQTIPFFLVITALLIGFAGCLNWASSNLGLTFTGRPSVQSHTAVT